MRQYSRHVRRDRSIGLARRCVARAQVSSYTIKARTDASGVLPGASVIARDVQSGFTTEAVSESDGAFTLAGLRPGRYEIKVAVAQYKPEAKTVEVLVGQTVTLNFRISPDVVFAESVTVVGNTRLVDSRTSEVTTNVTQEQLRYLPQNSRNFLNFAALAPGVRVSDNEFRKEFSAGALPSQNINVFIDGVSFKNDVIDGGLVGQDSSRATRSRECGGVPVLTQNFPSRIREGGEPRLTAVTRSGATAPRSSLQLLSDRPGSERASSATQPGCRHGETTPSRRTSVRGGALGGPTSRPRAVSSGRTKSPPVPSGNVLADRSTAGEPGAAPATSRFFTSPFRENLLRQTLPAGRGTAGPS